MKIKSELCTEDPLVGKGDKTHRGQPGLGLPAEHGVDGLLPELAEGVPEREVEGGERLDGKALPAVVDGRPPALVPDQLHVAGVLGGYSTAS